MTSKLSGMTEGVGVMALGGVRAERTMDVHIIAEDKPLWSGSSTSVVVPTMEGYMGILPDHEPVLALVGRRRRYGYHGMLRIRRLST